ncbi:LysR family transcriptional regulator, partial [Acinetobacter baumannii]
INVFVAVVDANGFAGAARKLNISPPAVTRAINELESHLGVRLLTRTTRVVKVTESGARYAEDCRHILAQLAEADESVAGMQRTPR